MRIVERPEEVDVGSGGVVFAAGFFDGVHVGHRAILRAAREWARDRGAAAWALTFDPHPLAVLAPDRAPALLTPGATRFEALEAAGAEGCLALPFSPELASMEPAEFVRRVLGAVPGPVAVVAGPDWRFGRGRAGSLADLPALWRAFVGAEDAASGGASRPRRAAAIEVREVPFEMVAGAPASSSRVRDAVRAGQLALTTAMLGRPYAIRERALGAAEGRGVGAKLGAPTANILPESPVLPPTGVYAVDVAVRAEDSAPALRARRAVANFGFRPTFPDARPDRPLLEVFIPGFEGDLHGRALDVAWRRRLRGERAFESPSALAAQIRADAEEALRP